eukprot:TRINITY_DN2124_c0_g1_i3.p1 TRINITY_DN2124_c0_g1~~TRINITY_DN2124_c0_g1_i3.p1  ORF type:complete len:159 (-),score=23.61 TRINITY_DN2124_c0_g1_i3:146-622(-)
MASGDVTSQFLLSPEGHSFVWKRTAHIFCFGFCVSAPVYHNWYRLVETQIPGKSVLQVIKKVLADQTLMAPLVITTLFFSIGWRQGKSFDQTWKKWQADFIPTMKANYSVWPFVTFVGYKFVPIQIRVAYLSSVSLFWNVYLSYMAHRKIPTIRENFV